MDITIAIVNYNTKHLLKQCIKNIVESNLQLAYEILIIDNASRDGSAEFIEKELIPFYPSISLIKSKTNLGFGKGYNKALEKAASSYLLLLNADIVILGDSITKLYTFIKEHSSCGIVGPKLIYPDGTVQTSYHRFPRFTTPLYTRTPFGKTIWGIKELARYNMDNPNFTPLEKKESSLTGFTEPVRVDWIVGACMLIKKDLWNKTGGFDTRYFLYYEDIDLCQTVGNLGLEIWYCPNAQMMHYHKRLSAEKKWWASIFYKTSRIHIHSHFKYFRKWGIR